MSAEQTRSSLDKSAGGADSSGGKAPGGKVGSEDLYRGTMTEKLLIRAGTVTSKAVGHPLSQRKQRIEGIASAILGVATDDAESKTFTFLTDPWNLVLDNGQTCLTLSQILLTYILAPDTSGVLVSYATLKFTLATYKWRQIGSTVGPTLDLYSENSAGGLLDDWSLGNLSVNDCNQTITAKAYIKTFDPNYYPLVEEAQLLIAASTWYAC